MAAAVHARWRWLRWAFALLGALLLVGSFIVYEEYVENRVYDGFAPANNTLQWGLLALAVPLLAWAVLGAAGVPARHYLGRAVLWELLGAIGLLAAWALLMAFILAGCTEC